MLNVYVNGKEYRGHGETVPIRQVGLGNLPISKPACESVLGPVVREPPSASGISFGL